MCINLTGLDYQTPTPHLRTQRNKNEKMPEIKKKKMEKREIKGNRKRIANTVYKKGMRSKGRGVFELLDVGLMGGRGRATGEI